MKGIGTALAPKALIVRPQDQVEKYRVLYRPDLEALNVFKLRDGMFAVADVPPAGDHAYVNAPVPPFAFTVALPLEAPHDAGIVEVIAVND